MNFIDFGSWAAWANAAVATIGLGGILYQARKARQLNSANLILALESKFGEPAMIRSRKEIAELVRVHLNTSQNALTGYHPIISFYDMLGALVHRGVLDETLIWHRFGWRVIRCWLAIASNPDQEEQKLPSLGSLIDRMRRVENEPLIYEQLEWLGNRFVEQDVRLQRNGKRHSKLQIYEMVMQYYEQESALV